MYSEGNSNDQSPSSETKSTVTKRQVRFKRVSGFIQTDENGDLSYPHIPCLCCNTDLGQVEGGCWSVNIYLDPLINYSIGYICDRCLDESDRSDEFDLASKIQQTLVGLLRDIADNLEKSELQINKPTH